MKRTILAAALLMAAGCSSPEKARTVDPLRVATVVAAPSADAGAAIYVGTIEEEASASLSFPVPGTVARTFADEGQRVRQGQAALLQAAAQALRAAPPQAALRAFPA